jgi:hypothetical protein
MTKDEALKLALEALENFADVIKYDNEQDDIGCRACCYVLSYDQHSENCKATKAITAIKQTRSAPVGHRDGHWCADLTCKKCYSADFRLKHTTPPAAQRQWVGLTDEEIDLFINGRGDEDDDDYVEPTGDGYGLTDADLVKLVRRAEAKLKERNKQGEAFQQILSSVKACAIADEREACAKLFDDRNNGLGFYEPHEPAEIIRARGNT